MLKKCFWDNPFYKTFYVKTFRPFIKPTLPYSKPLKKRKDT